MIRHQSVASLSHSVNMLHLRVDGERVHPWVGQDLVVPEQLYQSDIT